MRALLGTASHFCEVVVLKLRTVPIGTAPQNISEASYYTFTLCSGFSILVMPVPQSFVPRTIARSPENPHALH